MSYKINYDDNRNVKRGDTLYLEFLNIGTISPLSTVSFAVRKRPDMPLLITHDPEDGVNGTVFVAGKVVVKLTPAQTQTITPGLYEFDLQITSNGEITTVRSGVFNLLGDVATTGTITPPLTESDIWERLARTVSSGGASIIGALASYWTIRVGEGNEIVERVLQWLDGIKAYKSGTFTNNKLLRSDGTNGTVKSSSVGLDDSGNVTGLSSINLIEDLIVEGETEKAPSQNAVFEGLEAVKEYADELVVGLWDDRGNYDASSNLFPSSGGSGTAGSINKGDIWTISDAGTLGGKQVEQGDTVRAIIDTPGQTAGNWSILQNKIGYTPENLANKNSSGGYAGLSLFKIMFRNAANTFTNFFTNATTASRTYTFPDKDMTVAGLDDIAAAASPAKGYISGGLLYNTSSLPPKISAGSYEISGILVNKSSDISLSLTDVIGYSRQALDTYSNYLIAMNSAGNAIYCNYGEGPISGHTGNITSIVETAGTYRLTKSSGTFSSADIKRTVIITDGTTTIYIGKITNEGGGDTWIEFLAPTGLTFPISGTFTILGRLTSLHGTGSSTEISTDGNIGKYTPSLGENGITSIAAFDPSRNGFYLILLGLTDYRVLGPWQSDGSANVSTTMFSYESGRNKNDNHWLVTTISAMVANAIRWSNIEYLYGCDYIYTDNGSTGSEWAINRNADLIASLRNYVNGGNLFQSILVSKTSTNTYSADAVDQFIGYTPESSQTGPNTVPSPVFSGSIVKPLSEASPSSGARVRFNGSLKL